MKKRILSPADRRKSPEIDAYDRTTAGEFLGLRGERQHRSGRRRKRKLNRKQIRKLPFWDRYNLYLNSDQWLKFRRRILKERGNRCEECSSTEKPLHLHHLTYKRLGNEYPADVKVLCLACHEKEHGRHI